MKKRLPAIALLVASAALTVVCLVLLPDTVTTQITLGGSAATTMPKLFAVLIPAALGVGGSLVSLLGKSESNKPLLISAVGILVFIIMLAVNL